MPQYWFIFTKNCQNSFGRGFEHAKSLIGAFHIGIHIAMFDSSMTKESSMNL